eukprot:jgi/Ulvmu1/10806/UM069_0042.1
MPSLNGQLLQHPCVSVQMRQKTHLQNGPVLQQSLKVVCSAWATQHLCGCWAGLSIRKASWVAEEADVWVEFYLHLCTAAWLQCVGASRARVGLRPWSCQHGTCSRRRKS